MNSERPPEDARERALIVRIRNWVGDVLLGLPALELLQAHGYRLHLVARGKWAPALLAGYGWDVHVQPAGLRAKVAQLRRLRAACRAADPGFDRRENAFLLPVSFSSALEMRLAGLAAVGVAKEGRSFLLARAEPWATQGHELERYWDIACRFLRAPRAGLSPSPSPQGVKEPGSGHSFLERAPRAGLSPSPPPEGVKELGSGPSFLEQQRPPAPRAIGFRVDPAKAEAAARLLSQHGIAGPFVVVCPFAGGKAATADKADKKWPGFADFVARGAAELGHPLVIYPGPGEHDDARRLYPAATLLDGGDLAIYAALLQRASLVVANDTGPGHLAAALGRPTLSVLGATDAARWAPWGPTVHVLQRQAPGGETRWPEADEAFALARRLLAGASAPA